MNKLSESGTHRTWNVKKTQKREAKKRKLEAFLNLIKDEEQHSLLKKKKSKETLQDSYKTLKNELKKYAKKAEKNPFLALTQSGLKSHVNLRNIDKSTAKRNFSPLCVEDVHNLLLRSLMGVLSPFDIRWAKIESPNNVVKTVLVVIDGLSKSCVVENVSHLKNIVESFPICVEIISSHMPFATELSTLHMVSDFKFGKKVPYSSLFPVEEKVEDILPKKRLVSKVHLLLSPIQMVMENYPLPKCVFEQSNSTDYVFTKELYSPVTANSPMFAIDCEMCQTISDPNAVTRVAMVDEKLETVYHSFVIPATKIVDYRTKYSGVTAALLQNVNTRLSDVQKAIQRILPPDAILCGQSLNCDLHALQLIHPYVIDTSVIFNNSGIREKKNSLKKLTAMHLNESIQGGTKGHSPIEDSVATMKLVQVKLCHSVEYGDAVLENTAKNGTEIQDTSDPKGSMVQNQKNNVSKYTDNESDCTGDGFFSKVLKSSKKICIVGNKYSIDSYPSDLLPSEVIKMPKSSVKKIMKTASNILDDFDFVTVHLPFEKKEDALSELDIQIKSLFDACPSRTLFMIVASGVDESKGDDISSGLCMTALTKQQTPSI